MITGAYAGLGAATTKALLAAGAKVIVAGRNPQSQVDFVKGLTTSGLGFDASLVDGTHTMALGSLASVRDFAKYVKKNYERIDCLINKELPTANSYFESWSKEFESPQVLSQYPASKWILRRPLPWPTASTQNAVCTPG